MILRFGQLSALALTSIFILSSCAANTVPTTPTSQGFGQSASDGQRTGWDVRIANASKLPNVTCPVRFTGGCGSVSKSEGAEFAACYGPKGRECDPSNAGKVKWSGFSCLAKSKTCRKPIKQLTSTWTGPFKCHPQDGCRGTFELLTIKPGPGLKETAKYLYMQEEEACASPCIVKYIGLSVGP